MKVYVVTAGAYSDYRIKKIFIDKAKAEEYKEWLPDANDIEEYETEDNLVMNKYYKIVVSYRVNDNGLDESPYVGITKCLAADIYGNSTHYAEYYFSRCFVLNIVRFIPEQNWNEEFYKNKYTKAIYDLAAIAKYKKQEGFSEKDINMLFNGMTGEIDG